MIYKTLHSGSICQNNLLQILFKEWKDNGASIKLAWDPIFALWTRPPKGMKILEVKQKNYELYEKLFLHIDLYFFPFW